MPALIEMKGYTLLLLIGGVGQVGPTYKRRNTCQFLVKKKGNDSHI